MNLHCAKCLTSRTGDVLGAPCRTSGCVGVIAELPAFATLVDSEPEPMTCGRRSDTYPGGFPVHPDRAEQRDHWQRFKSNGNRVCSYCGSLHPDDMFALVKASAEAAADADYRSVVEVEPSDKGYKIYIHQPGVRNAMEGGIKFYTQHLPRTPAGKSAVTEEQQAEFGQAVARSKARFDKMLYANRKAAPKEPDVVSLDDPTVPDSLVPIPPREHQEPT